MCFFWTKKLCWILIMGIPLLLLGSQAAYSQQLPKDDSDRQGFQIGVDVDQVFLSVNARSKYGGFVEGLGKEEFRVFESGVEQQIVNFYSQGMPVQVVLLIDVSGSTRRAQSEISKAAMGFAASLESEDQISVVTFSDDPRLILNWTNDIQRVTSALHSIYAKGATVLHDALYVVFDDLLRDVEGKKAVIILTDGIDTGSMVGQAEVMQLAVRSETIVYVVSKLEEYWAGAIAARAQLHSQSRWIPEVLKDSFILEARQFLERLAQRTGGKILSAQDFSTLRDVYRQVAEELKNQYYISYISSNIMKDGRWREIEVRTQRREVEVNTRPGYYAPLESGQTDQ
jgi:Ca-activated chloride channel family protein